MIEKINEQKGVILFFIIVIACGFGLSLRLENLSNKKTVNNEIVSKNILLLNK